LDKLGDIEPKDQIIDLRDYLGVLWGKRVRIIIYSSLFALASVVYSLVLDNYYTSESVLQVNQQEGVNPNLGQFASLGSLAGLNFGLMDSDKSAQAMALIESRTFLKHLMDFENVLPSLMAAESYDKDNGRLIFDENFYDSETKKWKENSVFKNDKPTYLETYKTYSKTIYVKQLNSGFISLKVEHLSPYFAQEFLQLIIEQVNFLMRQEEIMRTERAREYLEKQLGINQLVEVNSAISYLIENNLKKEVAARLDEFYVLKPIEEPFVPEKKSKPYRALISILGTVLGFIFSCIFILVRNKIKNPIHG
jgi:uncharacterized protein involved in exopolysaccharide biosynthesis|tara:strand:+ start:220 stop:1143 length:924 start_codon:yes stop_codon:yes gene_type:complete